MVSFETGTFIVDSSGEVQVDYLFDGGWFRGELAVFSLDGMEAIEPGSTEFMLEAARRALTDSTQGRIIVQDQLEAARFGADLAWERNFNHAPPSNPGEYQGVKTFNLTPGDEVAFMLVQHTTVAETFQNPDNVSQFGKLPLFSIPEANLSGSLPNQFEFVDVDGLGTISLEDVPINQADKDYNDMILQVVGLEGNLAKLEDHINPDRDWRTTSIGQQLLEYTESRVFNEGVFKVGATGEIIIDFIYDGGLYEGEVGIFSLEGLNPEDMGSEAFIEEAVNRSKSNSTQGHVVVKDAEQGARFSANFDWEQDFNQENYPGRQTFQMNPGELFGLILVPNGTLDEALSAHESILSKDPLFSMSSANINNRIQFVDIFTGAEGTVVGFEDVHLDRQSNQDYNDIILAIEGVQQPIGLSAIEDVIFPRRNWLGTEVGDEDILHYFDNLDLI